MRLSASNIRITPRAARSSLLPHRTHAPILYRRRTSTSARLALEIHGAIPALGVVRKLYSCVACEDRRGGEIGPRHSYQLCSGLTLLDRVC